jgi:hypothetical protein
MKNLQSLLPALIIALAVLGGLLEGAKIISNGIVEASRFQFALENDGTRWCFDSVTGIVFWGNSRGVWRNFSYSRMPDIESVSDWANYLEDFMPRDFAIGRRVSAKD